MPRRLSADMTFDALEDEILFTRAALQADDRAAPLLERTATWLDRVAEVRKKDLEVREAVANAGAGRAVNNGNLDAACTSFGDQLLLAVGKDRSSPRWTGFFKEQVSRFVESGLASQVERVLSWLRSSTDPVLEQFRAELTKWATGAASALELTADLSLRRSENWQRREKLALELTQDRDRLHAELAEIGRQKGLPRDWPDLFFAVTARKGGKSATDAPPEEAAVSGAAVPGGAAAPETSSS